MLKKNIFSNFLSSAWIGLIGIVFIPYYVTIMGAEAFALISVFIALANIMTVMDIGISPTLNRELASSSVQHNIRKMKSAVHSLERIYIPIIATVCAILLLMSPYIANSWLNNNQLTTEEISNSLRLISIIIPLHLLTNFYSAGISGLQHQLPLSVINSTMAALRYAVVVPIMHIYTPTPMVFFIWQLCIGTLNLIVVWYFLHRKTHVANYKPEFNFTYIRSIWRFSAGVGIVTILGIILSNIDKIFLSKYLSLSEFGYYSVASIIAMSIAPRIASPFFSAFYPKFTQCIKQAGHEEKINLYHTGASLLALSIIPVSLFISLHAENILTLWTSDPLVVEHSKTVLSLLTLGCMFNGILYIPYAMQLAHGLTKISTIANGLSIAAFILLIIYLHPTYGVDGIAFSWLLINFSSTILSVFVLHNKVAKKEFSRWLLHDNVSIILVALTISLLLDFYVDNHTIYTLATTLICMIIAPATLLPSVRDLLFRFLQGRIK